jgi:hypothetical protein
MINNVREYYYLILDRWDCFFFINKINIKISINVKLYLLVTDFSPQENAAIV